MALAWTLAAPSHAQDRDKNESATEAELATMQSAPSPTILTIPLFPPRVETFEPTLIPDRVTHIYETCQLLKQDPDNGIASARITVPWRAPSFVQLIGAAAVPLRKPEKIGQRGLAWKLGAPRSMQPIATGSFQGSTSLLAESDGIPVTIATLDRVSRVRLDTLIDADSSIEWRNEEALIGTFPATWLDTGNADWRTCREQLATFLRNRRAPGTTFPASPEPIGDKQTWIRSQDYPGRSLRDEETGVVIVDLDVDEYGFPSRCRVAESSGFERLDTAACRALMRRAKFYPARNARDVSIPGTSRQPVRWQLED